MRGFLSIASVTLGRCISVLGILLAPQAVWATTWQATAGAQTTDEGIQALAFLAKELWVNVGDTITWTFPTGEIHTVTFLTPQQVRPPRPGVGGGCPAPGTPTTPTGSSFDGSTCLTSPELIDGQTYTVTFPTAGNFKLVCLVHNNMTGAVHVASGPPPHNQAFYDSQAHIRQAQLLLDGGRLQLQGTVAAQQSSPDAVTVGIGEIVATGGGSDSVSVMRFLQNTIVVRVGDTVEWTNLDPITPHTVTFGTEPTGSPTPPSAGVTVDADGARNGGTIASPTQSVHSGFIQAAFQDRVGLAQTPLGVTRFRVTFNTPGTFNYICALHDDIGMVGRVIVH